MATNDLVNKYLMARQLLLFTKEDVEFFYRFNRNIFFLQHEELIYTIFVPSRNFIERTQEIIIKICFVGDKENYENCKTF